jgi:endonuclease/exonuclease/phosphatase family metal-dependent hydrolase
VISFNIEGIVKNAGRLKSLLPDTILAIQEHWLFDFEKDNIKDICPSHDYFVKCVDANDPIHPSHRPRGHGGVAILWPRSITHAVTILPDGNERVAAISIAQPHSKDIVIISAYLPCRGNRGAEEDFAENLDAIFEVISKFRPTHEIVICGDFNANLAIQRNSRDSHALTFIDVNKLYLPVIPNKPTFYHHNDVDTNILDYIVATDPGFVGQYMVHDRDSSCTSSHVPVTVRLPLLIISRPMPRSEGKPIRKQVWEKCDEAAFNLALAPLLESLPAELHSKPQIDGFVSNLSSYLSRAASRTVPVVTIKPNKRRPWSSTIKAALKTSKTALHNWQVADKPSFSHPVSIARREARKLVRRSFRIHTAKIRRNLLAKVMDSHSNKTKLFYKLVAKQRSGSSNSSMALSIQGRLITEADELSESWADYFYKLGTPSGDPSFCPSYKNQIEADLEQIRKFLASQNRTPASVTIKETLTAIGKLNTGKAPDPMGLQAEHFRKASSTLAPYLSTLYTAILRQGHIPESLQIGTRIPIPKKDKDTLQPSNYRGITLTAMLTKILEHILLGREEHHVTCKQSDLQIGFTQGLSPSWGSLMLTESINECKDNKLPVYTAALDVQKVFDTVWHDSVNFSLLESKTPG